MCGLCLWCSLMFHRTMIENMIKEGKIVPSEVTIKLLQEAMIKNENDKFLIDGFPRNEENRAAFENVVRPLFHTQNLFVFSSHDSLRDYNSILLGTYNCICGSLIVSKCFRLKFLLHSCYSLTVPRKRWKDVFWGATRFPSWLINCVSFSHRILVSNISYCAFRGELMITLRLLRKGSKLLWNQVYLS